MHNLTKAIDNLKVSMKREKFLIFANIAAIGVTFLILGLFINVVVISRTALRYLEDQAQITVFFKDDFSESSILALQKELDGDSRLLSSKYVSKEEAFKIFSEMNKDQPVLLDSISKNVLPASLELRTKNLADLGVLSDELGKRDGVEEVKFFKDVIERFKTWSSIIYAVGLVLAVVFLFISYSIIVVTLRITIHAKGTELEILKLVGATDKYIKSPLVYQGMVLGFFAALLAVVIVFAINILLSAIGIVPFSSELYVLPGVRLSFFVFSLVLSLVLLLSGCALGYIGSLSALRKYLK